MAVKLKPVRLDDEFIVLDPYGLDQVNLYCIQKWRMRGLSWVQTHASEVW